MMTSMDDVSVRLVSVSTYKLCRAVLLLHCVSYLLLQTTIIYLSHSVAPSAAAATAAATTQKQGFTVRDVIVTSRPATDTNVNAVRSTITSSPSWRLKAVTTTTPKQQQHQQRDVAEAGSTTPGSLRNFRPTESTMTSPLFGRTKIVANQTAAAAKLMTHQLTTTRASPTSSTRAPQSSQQQPTSTLRSTTSRGHGFIEQIESVSKNSYEYDESNQYNDKEHEQEEGEVDNDDEGFDYHNGEDVDDYGYNQPDDGEQYSNEELLKYDYSSVQQQAFNYSVDPDGGGAGYVSSGLSLVQFDRHLIRDSSVADDLLNRLIPPSNGRSKSPAINMSLLVIYSWLGLVVLMVIVTVIVLKYKQQLSWCRQRSVELFLCRKKRRQPGLDEGNTLLTHPLV